MNDKIRMTNDESQTRTHPCEACRPSFALRQQPHEFRHSSFGFRHFSIHRCYLLLIAILMLPLLGGLAGCADWFPGPRYPRPSPPLIEEPTKPIDLGCAVNEMELPRRAEAE